MPNFNGLDSDWSKYTDYSVFINPPFGRSYIHKVENYCIPASQWRELSKETKKEFIGSSVADWVSKTSYHNLNDGLECFLLIPASVDTSYWQNIIFDDHEAGRCKICFFSGRIKFVGAEASCPMPIALIYYGQSAEHFKDIFSEYGYVI